MEKKLKESVTTLKGTYEVEEIQAMENEMKDAFKDYWDKKIDMIELEAVKQKLSRHLTQAQIQNCRSDASIEYDKVQESKKVETVDNFNDIVVINPQDSQYYDNLYLVSLDTGVQGQCISYKVYADYEEQALEIAISYAEDHTPYVLTSCMEMDPDEAGDEGYTYVDATEYGAKEPYYILNTFMIKLTTLTESLKEESSKDDKESMVSDVWKEFWDNDELYNLMVNAHNEGKEPEQILKDTDWAKNIKTKYNLNNLEFNNLISTICNYWNRNSFRYINKTTESVTINEIEEITQRIESAEDMDEIQQIIYTISDGVLEDEVQNMFDGCDEDDDLDEVKSLVLTTLEDNAEYDEEEPLTEASPKTDKVLADIINDEKDSFEQKTILDDLEDRIGQKMTVGELNTILQSLFGQYNKIFLLVSDLYNQDPDELQELVVWDDNDMYTITYEITNIMKDEIALTDVVVE